MKKMFWTMAFISSLINPQHLFADFKPKKLILHFDVNKTLIADDFSVGKTVDDIIIYALADHYKDKWEASLISPISYSQYIDTHILPGNKSDKILKAARNKKKLEFIEYLKEHNHRWYHDALTDCQTMKDKLTHSKSIVFNAFYQLLKYLDEEGYNYTIILRTFGFDIPRVKDDIEQALSAQFFTTHSYFKNGALHTEHHEQPLENITDIYAFFCNTNHCTVHDDYTQWNSNNEHKHHGKKFPIAIDDTSIISLFFDDNIITDAGSESNIVSPIDAITGQPLEVYPLILKNIIPVNTVQAILDDTYFIEKVTTALKNHYDSIKTAD